MELPNGYTHIVLDKVGSTNEEAARFLDEGAASNRTVITAKEQGAGRGRGSRTWSSPPGNLYATLLLSPERAENEWPHLCFVVSLAIAEALKSILNNKANVQVKWPNDVLVGGRKIGGILLEHIHAKSGQKFILVGFGVNCRNHPDGGLFPATHLVLEGVAQADATPEAVLALILQQFEPLYQNWLAMGLKNIRPAWLNLAKNLGETISIRVSDFLPDGGKITGQFVDVDEESGALLLKEQDGLVHRITHGDVFFPDKSEKAS
ncbi:MAG: biotin--[acetyl-CoA-carboxylase] ligase [Alphaproteobacteria bacterium]|nr:biotin--[acetyl-CoA-carboxylase] ligase [Alphaproteobacteria bacterium]